MRRRDIGNPPPRLTARELVDAVEAVPEEQRDERLAELGYDGIEYIRARVALKMPPHIRAGYAWDDETRERGRWGL